MDFIKRHITGKTLFFGLCLTLGSILVESSAQAYKKIFIPDYPLLSIALSVTLGSSAFCILTLLKRGINPLPYARFKANLFCSVFSSAITFIAVKMLSELSLFEFASILLFTDLLIIISGGLLLKESLKFTTLFGITLTLIGAIFSSRIYSPEPTLVSPFALIYALCLLGRVLARKATALTTPKEAVMFFDTVIPMIFFSTLCLATQTDVQVVIPVIFVGFGYGLAKLLYIWAIHISPLKLIGVVGFCNAIAGLFYDYVVFHHIPSYASLLGCTLIITGIHIVYKRAKLEST